VILDPDYEISGHVLDQPKPHQYAPRQIGRAREEAVDPELAELNAAHVVILSGGPKGKCRVDAAAAIVLRAGGDRVPVLR
jgi:hypothetical protein